MAHASAKAAKGARSYLLGSQGTEGMIAAW